MAGQVVSAQSAGGLHSQIAPKVKGITAMSVKEVLTERASSLFQCYKRFSYRAIQFSTTTSYISRRSES